MRSLVGLVAAHAVVLAHALVLGCSSIPVPRVTPGPSVPALEVAAIEGDEPPTIVRTDALRVALSAGRVLVMPREGGASFELALAAPGAPRTGKVCGAVVQDGAVYVGTIGVWLGSEASPGALWRIDLAAIARGERERALSVWSLPWSVEALAATSWGELVWLDRHHGAVVRAAGLRDGGAAEVVARLAPQPDTPPACEPAFALDGTGAYLFDDRGDGERRLLRVALTSGETETLARETAVVGALALDAQHVYWAAEEPGLPTVIRRRDKHGAAIEDVRAAQGSVRELIVAHGMVYWLGRHPGERAPRYEILRAPLAPSDAPSVRLFDAPRRARGLSLDGAALEWVEFGPAPGACRVAHASADPDAPLPACVHPCATLKRLADEGPH